MRVNGNEIPQAAIDAALVIMQRHAGFRLQNLRGVIEAFLLGGTKYTRRALAHSVAERLIQKARRAGQIGPLNAGASGSPYWRWISRK